MIHRISHVEYINLFPLTKSKSRCSRSQTQRKTLPLWTGDVNFIIVLWLFIKYDYNFLLRFFKTNFQLKKFFCFYNLKQTSDLTVLPFSVRLLLRLSNIVPLPKKKEISSPPHTHTHTSTHVYIRIYDTYTIHKKYRLEIRYFFP